MNTALPHTKAAIDKLERERTETLNKVENLRTVSAPAG